MPNHRYNTAQDHNRTAHTLAPTQRDDLNVTTNMEAPLALPFTLHSAPQRARCTAVRGPAKTAEAGTTGIPATRRSHSMHSTHTDHTTADASDTVRARTRAHSTWRPASRPRARRTRERLASDAERARPPARHNVQERAARACAQAHSCSALTWAGGTASILPGRPSDRRPRRHPPHTPGGP